MENIISLNSENEKIWAKLCCRLWPENNIDSFLKDNKDNNEWAFLYKVDNKYVGFINLSLRNDYVEGTSTCPVAYIEGIYVIPTFRKKGIAKALIEFSKIWAIEQGCSELASDCELTNQISRDFHKNVGFEEVNIIVCYTMKLK